MPPEQVGQLLFGLLGPVEARVGDRLITFGSGKQRALLALLVLKLGEPVSRDRLIDVLWGEQPPPSAEKMVHVFVSRLRATLGAETIATTPAGYVLHAAADAVDVARFDELVAEAQSKLEDDPSAAEAQLRMALSL